MRNSEMKDNIKSLKALNRVRRFRISGSTYLDVGVINGSFAVKSKGLIVAMFARMLSAIGLGTTKFRVSAIVHLIRKFSDIHNKQGMKGLIAYLKANTVLLQQSLSGFRLRDISPLGPKVSRTNRGLPRIILGQDRALIRAGDYKLMRFYLTVLNLYRVLEMPGKLKLNTITDGFKGDPSLNNLFLEVNRLVPEFAKVILSLAGDKLDSEGIKPSPILKSAPGTAGPLISTNPLILIKSARNLRLAGLDACILYFSEVFKKATKVRYPGFTRIFLEAANLALVKELPSDLYPMGKIGFKEEAAGKVRAFAMVDAWTQWVLEPLHKEIFRILKFLPMDGTFDQIAPVLNYRDWPNAYSLDLTAATDRIPIGLQINLLSCLYGQEFAVKWAQLLVGRSYSYYYHPDKKREPISGEVKYAVGQPMGALSSWAMLALTHHCIVQVAAWLSGETPKGDLYRNYAVLGDDLVIGNRRVKDMYLLVLRALGVECGLAKSVLSTRAKGIEFAKRTFVDGVDVSPFPIKEFLSACLSLPSALAVAQKYKLTLPQLVKTLGYGYRVLGSLNQHVGRLNSRVRALVMGYNVPVLGAPDSAKAVGDFLGKGNPIKKLADPAVVDAFNDVVLTKVEATISKALKFHLGTYIKDTVKEFRQKLWNHFGIVYLRGIAEYRNPTDSAIALSSGQPKSYSWDNLPRVGEVTLPPDVYNRVENDLRDADLLLTNLFSMLMGDDLAHGRDLLFKLKSDLNRLRYSRDIGDAFQLAMKAIKDLDNLPVVSTSMTRVESDARNILDMKQIHLWRLWSELLLQSYNNVTVSGKFAVDDNSIAAVMARNRAGIERRKAKEELKARQIKELYGQAPKGT